eukprot:CAMPEP_0171622782 /NCGR_PEP_ID=MMETSP0990-20121206/17491_1 /TAXON_ID=483369 /ORGANISM="non described non described, Strain CCMP2098" /LENGTH=50 /DNA_ID=CAMNT_0012188731 /DNA_START=613 /DNA_END=765 /DNA_ORIENTATION=+
MADEAFSPSEAFKSAASSPAALKSERDPLKKVRIVGEGAEEITSITSSKF